MDRFRAERYQRLESLEDIVLQARDCSIELTEYSPQQDAPPSYDDEHKIQKSSSRSIVSTISNAFKDSHTKELEDDELHTLNLQKNRKHIIGWRMGAVISACTAGFAMLVNLVFLVVAMVTVGHEGGIGTLYKGDCNTVKRWDTIIHLILNFLGVAILAASNFTVQCISSPTRQEVDKAHARRLPLDIGIPSAWNLRYMGWSKIVLWAFLMLSTLPLHLLWNSSIFSTIQTNEYTAIVVTPEFLSNGSTICDTHPSLSGTVDFDAWNPYLLNCSVIDFMRNGYSAGNYAMLTPSQCISAYGSTFIVGRRNVIAVMNISSTDANYYLWPPTLFNESIVDYITPTSMPPSMKFERPVNDTTLLSMFQPQPVLSNLPAYQWLCNYYTVKEDACTTQNASLFGSSWQILPTNYPIETCYSEKVPPLCKLEYGSLLVVIVLICNIVKTICMSITAWKLWRLDNPVLATIGDATASFLEKPDQTTSGCCLMDARSIEAWKKGMPVKNIYNPPETLRFFRAASIKRWIITMLCCLAYIIVASWLCSQAIHTIEAYANLTLTQVWDSGFGYVNPSAVTEFLDSGRMSDNILANVLIANLPQLILSITYFMYNAIYTAQLAAYEWNEYASRRKPLRVSFPCGNQISTYWLQLPFWYSIPLSVALAALHYFISQSIFLAYIEYYDTEGNFIADRSLPGLSYGPIAMLASIILAFVLILALIINSFRKLNPAIPLMRNNSAIISAACHPDPTRKEEFIQFKRIRWGATSPSVPGSKPGHCAFTSEDVPLPIEGQRYE